MQRLFVHADEQKHFSVSITTVCESLVPEAGEMQAVLDGLKWKWTCNILTWQSVLQTTNLGSLAQLLEWQPLLGYRNSTVLCWSGAAKFNILISVVGEMIQQTVDVMQYIEPEKSCSKQEPCITESNVIG